MKIMLAVIVLSIGYPCHGHTIESDSSGRDTVNRETKHRIVKRITTRLQSVGFFNFSGRICSHTPAADLNVLYEKNGYGVSAFSAVDLDDRYSENNFGFGIVYKRIVLSKRFTLTPNAGVVMEGLGRSFGDRIFLISTFKASPKLTIDETALFANLLDRHKTKEWVNRIRFIYSQTSHVQFVMSTWHNNAVLDVNGYLSGAFQASYNRIAIADHVYLQTAVTVFLMAANSEEVPPTEKNGLILTVGLSLE